MKRTPFKRSVRKKPATPEHKKVNHQRKEGGLFRSVKYRQLIASLPCMGCNRPSPSQCAHVNFGKGMGIKASDIMTFPLCPSCHREHDQGGRMSRNERVIKESQNVNKVRALFMAYGYWSEELESHFQREIQRLINFIGAVS